MSKKYTKGRSMDLTHIFLRYFFETEYMHFGYWDRLQPKFANLKSAQEAYVDRLQGMIPAGVKTILEVGCGSGEMAKRLLASNYQVDVVSPPSVMTNLAKEKLKERVHFHECLFEDFACAHQYDLVLFSESFQFVKLDSALRKARACGRYVLIADVFRKDLEERSPIGGGHLYSEYLKQVEANGLKAVADNDVSRQIAPQFDLETDLMQNFVRPMVSVLERMYQTSVLPVRLILRLLLFFNRKGLRKLREKHFSGTGKRSGAAFEKYKYYRFILLERMG